MAVAENRVEKAMERIEDGLKRMRTAMADVRNIDRVIKHEKARLIDSVILKYLNTTDPDERIQLGVLKRSRHQLMKEANPGMLNRIFPEISSTIRSVLDFFKDKEHSEKVAVQYVRQKQEAALAQDKLIKQVAEKGFPEVAADIRSGIKRGEDSFVVKWSVYKRENEKVEYDLHFKRDEQGKYNFEKVQATLKDKNKNLIRKLSLDMDGEMSFSPQQIYNLMCGRAVQLGGLKYIIDPNDMGADGNNTLRPSVASGDKFTAMLAELPFMQNRTPEHVKQTAGILLDGGNVPMDITLQGQQRNFFMEANSQHTGVNYFDENGVKTNLNLLFPEAFKMASESDNLSADRQVIHENKQFAQDVRVNQEPGSSLVEKNDGLFIEALPVEMNLPFDYPFLDAAGPAPEPHHQPEKPRLTTENIHLEKNVASTEPLLNSPGNHLSLQEQPVKVMQVEGRIHTTPDPLKYDAVNAVTHKNPQPAHSETRISAGGIILPDNNLTLDQIARNALKYGNDKNRDFFERTLNQAADNKKMQQQSRKGAKSMSH